MRYRWLVLVCVVACGKGSKENRKLCEQAAEKYTSCVRQILGPEMAAQMAAKDGVAACARDDKTVAMYRACLPKTDCDEFMECTEEYARNSAPTIAADKPRGEQCQQHVKDGLRGIAMQVVMMGEHAPRNAGDKQRGQDCTLDESKAWESCLEPGEIAEVKRYGVQRQSECEAWSPELAACILRLPGAKDCKPDEFPLWRLPIDEGPPGPKVAWTVSVADDDDYDDDVRFAWTTAGTLIVRDDNALRALHQGTERWTAPVAGVDVELAVAGGFAASRSKEEPHGVRLFDLATGTSTSVLEKTYVSVIGAVGDRLVAWTGSAQLYEIAPASCKKSPKTCTKLLGTVEDDGSLYVRTIGAWRDQLVLGASSGIVVVDRKGKQRFVIHVENNDVLLVKNNVIVADDKGLAILSLPRCSDLGNELYMPSTRAGDDEPPEDCPNCVLARGDCVVARRSVSWVSSVDPTALPDGSVAFNDEGITEKTHHFSGGTEGWDVETRATGGVAGDARHIYTVTNGLDGQGPFRLLALARENGKVVWQTDLPNAVGTSTTRIVVRDGFAAVRMGPTIYVIELE